MKIGRREVGPGHPVLVVAEIGSNHGGSLDRALALIDAAADAGADAAKFQRFRVDHFLVPRPDPEALRRYELPDDWLPALKSKCQSRDIELLCTAFDLDSLDVVDPFVNAHKIGSAEHEEWGYVASVVAKGKPVIMSLGGCTSEHCPRTTLDSGPTGMPTASGMTTDPSVGRPQILMRCVSEYPAGIDGYLHEHPFGRWGVSDHTLHPTIVPAAATALGACVVEKHMRLDGAWPEPRTPDAWEVFMPVTPDSPVSISAGAFKEMVDAIRLTEKAVRG